MADDGAGSLVQPTSAGELKKGLIGMFKGRPAKVMEVSVSKTGKHGHAKCSITAIDIFTNKKITDVQPSHAHMYQANPVKTEYQVMGIDTKENSVSVLDSENNTLEFPLEGDVAQELAADFDPEDSDNVWIVTVCKAPVGTSEKVEEWAPFEMIVAFKKTKAD